jgi:hypothetical protein
MVRFFTGIVLAAGLGLLTLHGPAFAGASTGTWKYLPGGAYSGHGYRYYPNRRPAPHYYQPYRGHPQTHYRGPYRPGYRPAYPPYRRY